MQLSKYLYSASELPPISQDNQGLFKLSPLFHYLSFFIALYVLKAIVSYFIHPDLEDKTWILIIPCTVLICIAFLMVIGHCKVKRLKISKQKIIQFIFLFDVVKILVYITLAIIITEFKLQDNSQRQENTPHSMFWLSQEVSFLTLPTILSMQTKFTNIFILAFHFLYFYVRMEGYSLEIADSSFFFIKIIPIALYLYRSASTDEKVQQTKNKQDEEGKFASKVLNLLPEGVAIVDEEGLQYINNSMRTIMKVKDDKCLETLYALENRQFIGESSLSSAFIKKSLSFGQSETRKPSIIYRREGGKPFLLKVETNFKERVKDKDRTEDSPKVTPQGSIFSFKSQTIPGTSLKKMSTFHKNLIEMDSDGAINGFVSTDKLSAKLVAPSSKGGREEISTRDKEDEGISAGKYRYSSHGKSCIGLSCSFREDRSIGSPLTVTGVASLKRRIKRILNRIEEPYRTSHHKTVKEAVNDILGKMREEFAPDAMSGSLMSLVSKIEKRYQRQSTLGSRPFSLGQRLKLKNQSLGANHWAVVMQSTREISKDISQYLEIKFTPIVTNGKPALIILVRDVTEKEIIKQMEEKERSQSLALASISHEFRTPLNGIMGMLSTLKEHINNDLGQNYLVPAFNSAKLLLTLVNDILDFHQMKEGKLVLVPVKFNLRSKLEESLSLISIQAKARGLELKVDIEKNMQKFICNDPNRLQQVVNNLVGNAIKFTVKGSITVRVEKYSSRKIAIKVIDTGIGIEPQDIEKLFTAFGKVDSKRNRELNPQGVGLGLTISNSLAKALCSDEKVSGLNVSSKPQQGSTFWFIVDDIEYPDAEYEVDDDEDSKTLNEHYEELNKKFFKEPAPASGFVFQFQTSLTTLRDFHTPTTFTRSPWATSIAGSSIQDSPTRIDNQGDGPKKEGGIRKKVLRRTHIMAETLVHLLEEIHEKNKKIPAILIVDDDEYNHLVLKGFLGAFKLEIHSAYNGKQGLEKIIERNSQDPNNPYLLALLDVEMPLMNGRQCAAELRALMEKDNLPKIPLIAQTGHNGGDEVRECIKAGMVDFIQKPIAKNKLIEMLVKWISKEE